MGRSINVDWAEIKNIGKDFENNAKEIESLKKDIFEIINLIDQSWKGTDATNFKTNIESDTNELNDEIIYLNSWSSYLSKASDGYDDTLHKYLSKIQELNSDFSDYKM